MLDENLEKNKLDKKALKGLLWKNIANRIGD
jgi:Ca2+-binding EF-hand superfamily protein